MEIGRSMSYRMNPNALAEWAGLVLIAAVRAFGSTSAIDKLIAVVSDVGSWDQCKEIFEEIRLETLATEKEARPSTALMGLLLLGENVAKILYNANCQRPVFRDGASDWIPHCVHAVCCSIEDTEARDELVAAVLEPLRTSVDDFARP